MTPDFFELLRKHNIAFVFADTAKKWPYAEDLTADFVYVRLHGDKKLYVSGYNDKALDWWAERIKKWRREKTTVRCKIDQRKQDRQSMPRHFRLFRQRRQGSRRHLMRSVLPSGWASIGSLNSISLGGGWKAYH